MKHLLRLTDWTREDLLEIFALADRMKRESSAPLRGKSVVTFFPPSSIRTRLTFEKGISLLGGQPILFPSDALDKRERLEDVMGYLNNWADCLVVRHNRMELLERLAECARVPVINAMTGENHPCEMLGDLYALSKRGRDIHRLRYLFVGACGNIGKAWREASLAFGLDLIQSCPPGYEVEGLVVKYDIHKAMKDVDVVLTDSLPAQAVQAFAPYRITAELLRQGAPGLLLNPCPPFFRGEEIDGRAIDSPHFVGYEFKAGLLPVQQAVLCRCMGIV